MHNQLKFLFFGFGFMAFLSHRGRTASCPAAPAQIPACSFSAPGSSEILASAIQPRPPKLPILPEASPQLGDVSLENAVAPL